MECLDGTIFFYIINAHYCIISIITIFFALLGPQLCCFSQQNAKSTCNLFLNIWEKNLNIDNIEKKVLPMSLLTFAMMSEVSVRKRKLRL